MGRALRLHHPGSAFHVVSRTQGKEPWFTDDVKDTIADLLLTGTTSAGASPVAFTVMDTHFHLILFQGVAPLGWTMQPILRRIALLIQKVQGREGHIFERRYRAKMCSDLEYLPNAILYVHRNPVKAGMCANANSYRWSSASAYDGSSPPGLLCVSDGLRAFDGGTATSVETIRDAYRERMRGVTSEDLDDYWSWFLKAARRRRKSSDPYIPQSQHLRRAATSDVRDAAVRILRSIDRNVDIELVRSRYGGAHIVNARTQLIAALLQREFAGISIARYLRISEATVSRVRSRMRWGSLPDREFSQL
jgi:REP element-mobilizing transposase RayT